jgi:hypothetical protein
VEIEAKKTMDMIDLNYNPAPPVVALPQLQGPWAVARGLQPTLPPLARTLLVLGSAAISGYHGTKRNGGSIFWGLVWFGLGATFPVVTPIIAVAQDLGECRHNCPTTKTVNLGRSARSR